MGIASGLVITRPGFGIVVDEQVDPRPLALVAHRVADPVVEVVGAAGAHRELAAADLVFDRGRRGQWHVDTVRLDRHRVAIGVRQDVAAGFQAHEREPRDHARIGLERPDHLLDQRPEDLLVTAPLGQGEHRPDVGLLARDRQIPLGIEAALLGPAVDQVLEMLDAGAGCRRVPLVLEDDVVGDAVDRVGQSVLAEGVAGPVGFGQGLDQGDDRSDVDRPEVLERLAYVHVPPRRFGLLATPTRPATLRRSTGSCRLATLQSETPEFPA